MLRRLRRHPRRRPLPAAKPGRKCKRVCCAKRKRHALQRQRPTIAANRKHACALLKKSAAAARKPHVLPSRWSLRLNLHLRLKPLLKWQLPKSPLLLLPQRPWQRRKWPKHPSLRPRLRLKRPRRLNLLLSRLRAALRRLLPPPLPSVLNLWPKSLPVRRVIARLKTVVAAS